jgi:hypothetical protein
MREQLFRKSALERLSSPEELDSLMQVTNPKGWIALLALGGLVLVAFAWGVFGSIPVKIICKGVFSRPERVQEIDSTADGKVVAIYAAKGQIVRKGQVVARVAKPGLLEEITRSKAMLKEMKAVYEKGALQALKQKIEIQERLIVKLDKEFELSSRMISRYDGRILQIYTSEGRYIKTGDRIMAFEREGDSLEAVLFTSFAEGHKILPGMKVLVSPSLPGQEAGGSILGTVARASAVTAAHRKMLQGLRNGKALQGLPPDSSLMEIQVELLLNPASGNGYQWTSGKGPSIKLQSNTTCAASVIVDEQPPLAIVIPLFRKSPDIGRESFEGT